MPADQKFFIRIEAGKSGKNYWRDLWRYRELFYILSWRDILVRYKQTVIGTAWGVVRPILTMAIFTIVFGRIAKLPTDGVPYPVFVFTGLLPWQFFSTALAESSNSLVGNANLITKVYFPRMIIPASSVITSFVDFIISFVLMAIMMIYYQVVPSINLILLPLFIVFAFACSFGVGLFLTALNVKYRDFRHIIPFIVQFGLYVSPVGYNSNIVPQKWRLLYSLNPMVGVIDGFRWCILGVNNIYWPGFWISITITLVVLAFGISYFRKTERTFADNI
jgi:lipopolysaccharide transport system permease protein